MKTDRLVAIIMVLLERGKVSARELAEMFEVSPRTIYRDLDAINLAGIPVVATPGPGGGAEILKTYKVEKRLFSTSDITALLMGLDSIQGNFPSLRIAGALAKIKGMVPQEKQKELTFRANQIKIDASPWLQAEDLSGTVEIVRTALERQCLLHFDYRDLKNQKSSRVIEPYRILLKGEDWYVQGYCLTRGDFRTFKLLRAQNIRVSQQTFAPRDFPADKLDDIQLNDRRLTAVRLRIHEEIRDLVAARFGAGCLAPDGPEHYIANVDMPIDDLACRYLLGFGDRCVCLAPQAMREKMRRLSQEIYHLYSTDQ